MLLCKQGEEEEKKEREESSKNSQEEKLGESATPGEANVRYPASFCFVLEFDRSVLLYIYIYIYFSAALVSICTCVRQNFFSLPGNLPLWTASLLESRFILAFD